MQRTASCACGALRLLCTGEPALVSLCHCRACQRRTGSPYGIAAFFEEQAVGVAGVSTVYSRRADSGFDVDHHFCPTCGSTVFWYARRKPGYVAVAVGAFADPDFPPPTKAVHDESRHRWVTVPAPD